MTEGQCPTCGRCSEDWATNRDLVKGQRREDREDRILEYKQWRWHLGHGCYVADVDAVEWRMKDDQLIPAAVFEMTRVDGNAEVPPSYLRAIIKRMEERDLQGKLAKKVAEKLGVKAWIVAFRHDLTDFWIYNLTDSRGWWPMTQEEYASWLKRM